MDISSLSNLSQGLTDEIKDAIDYWREYKGQEIRVERVSYNKKIDSNQVGEKEVFGVQGTVEKVMSLPPGFVLKDATEFNSVHFVEYQVQNRDELPDSEKHDRIFISFDTVERITFVDD